MSQLVGEFGGTAWFYTLLILLASPLSWILMGTAGIFRMRNVLHRPEVFCWSLRHIALKEYHVYSHKSKKRHLWGWVQDRGAWFGSQWGATVGGLVGEGYDWRGVLGGCIWLYHREDMRKKIAEAQGGTVVIPQLWNHTWDGASRNGDKQVTRGGRRNEHAILSHCSQLISCSNHTPEVPYASSLLWLHQYHLTCKNNNTDVKVMALSF